MSTWLRFFEVRRMSSAALVRLASVMASVKRALAWRTRVRTRSTSLVDALRTLWGAAPKIKGRLAVH